MDQLTQAALDTAQLPSLPDLVHDLQLLIDKNEDLNVIADLLATDVSLVTRVIELANSAFYGNKNISRIFDAVHVIGLNKILLFVRTACTTEILESAVGDRVDMKEFWKQSYVAALISQRIATKINFPQPDIVYTAGLLMFIGDLIIALLPEEFDRSRLEKNELAATQLELWGFPRLLVEAVRYYKTPSDSSDQYALPASILHICHCILMDTHDELDEDALHVTYLTREEIDHIADDINHLVFLQ